MTPHHDSGRTEAPTHDHSKDHDASPAAASAEGEGTPVLPDTQHREQRRTGDDTGPSSPADDSAHGQGTSSDNDSDAAD